MKNYLFVLLVLFCIPVVSATVVINLTMNNGTNSIYNTTFAQNMGTGLNFSCLSCMYAPTGGVKDSGYYWRDVTNVRLYSDNFRTVSDDALKVCVMGWSKMGSTTGGELVGHYNTQNGNRSWSTEIDVNNQFKVLLSTDGNSATKSYVTNGINMSDNQWHSWAFSWNGTNLSLYVDNAMPGVTKTTDTAMTTLQVSSYNVTAFVRGNSGVMDGVPYGGKLDEILVFNDSCSFEQYQSIYRSYLPSSDIDLTGLVSYYNFNSSLNLTDYTGLNNMTLYGVSNATYKITPIDYGYYFNRSNNTAMRVSSDTVSSSVRGNFTIIGIINISSYSFTGDRGIIMGKYYDGTTTQRSYMVNSDSTGGNCQGNLSMTVSSSTGSLVGVTTCANVSTSSYFNQWITVAFVYVNGTSQTIYINGVNVGQSTSGVATSVADSTGWLSIMSTANNLSTGIVNGTIEEIALFNRSLSAAEVASYNINRGLIYTNVSTSQCVYSGTGDFVQNNTVCNITSIVSVQNGYKWIVQNSTIYVNSTVNTSRPSIISGWVHFLGGLI